MRCRWLLFALVLVFAGLSIAPAQPPIEAFSVNHRPEKSNLERLPVEQIEAVFGKESVVPSDTKRTIQEILGEKFTSPIKLYPILMFLLLFLLAFENLFSNKFYKQPKPKEAE